MEKQVNNEYVDGKLAKTTIVHEDGGETVISYRDKIGGDLISPEAVVEPKKKVSKKKKDE